MKNELLESIIEAQKDRNGKLVDLVNRFKPLMNKYAYRLRYEDAFFDIQLRFIEIILNLNTNRLEALEYAELLTYICACVHNAYISLSKANCQYKGTVLTRVRNIRTGRGRCIRRLQRTCLFRYQKCSERI